MPVVDGGSASPPPYAFRDDGTAVGAYVDFIPNRIRDAVRRYSTSVRPQLTAKALGLDPCCPQCRLLCNRRAVGILRAWLPPKPRQPPRFGAALLRWERAPSLQGRLVCRVAVWRHIERVAPVQVW